MALGAKRFAQNRTCYLAVYHADAKKRKVGYSVVAKLNGEAGMDKEMFIQEIGFKSATGSTVVSFVGV